MNEVRVKVTDQRHLFHLARTSGLIDAQKLLEDLPANLRQTPGVALAIATIAAEANALRGEVIAKNLATIARAGHDIVRYKAVSFDPKTSDLVCEFYDPDLFDSQAGEG
jgi:hypothetical protein